MSVLRQLLDDGARFDAEYAGGLSNHLPMALVALKRLGADDARLAAFAERYRARLEPAPTAAPWPAGEPWQSRLGQREAWPAYRTLFTEWLGWEGAEAALGPLLPDLMAGCGAAAFHGLIRSAYALQVGHAGELADGLAYWACRWLPLGDEAPTPARRVRDPAVVWQRLQRVKRPPLPPRQLISERMQDAAALAAFAPAVASLRIDADTPDTLARQAAALYAASGNFTVLHLVTSAHALRSLVPFVDDPVSLHTPYWRAYAAGALAAGIGEPGATPEPLDWPALVGAAIGNDDEHVIKLVDSCRELEKVAGDGPWRAAATRAVLPLRA